LFIEGLTFPLRRAPNAVLDLMKTADGASLAAGGSSKPLRGRQDSASL